MLPYPFLTSFMMFFIYSFIGWVVEVIYYGITEEQFINRGFLAGPICPVYGLGFYAGIWLFEPFVGNFFIIFFGTAASATLVELIAGIILYRTFHMRWWDYSDYKLNFKGYICARFFIYWGIACSLGLYVLHPAVKWLIEKMPGPVFYILLSVFTVILISDIVVSVATIIGLQKKIKAFKKVTSGIKTVSDKIGSQIYGAVDTIVTVSEPTKKHYAEYRALITENRRIENEIAAAHRAAEKAFAEQFTAAEKESLNIAKQSAHDSLKAFTASLKHGERRLVSIVSVGYDTGFKKLSTLIRKEESEEERDKDI